jgi:hypothetical protein
MRLLGACVVGAAAIALATGCGTGTEKVIDSGTARPLIEKQIHASGGPAVKSIDCPQTKPEVGVTFTCHVTLQDGSAYDMKIRVDKVGAKHPLMTVVGSKLLIVGPSNVEPLIEEQIEETGAPPLKSVTCEHVKAKVEQTFTCEVKLGGGHVSVDGFKVLKLSDTAAPEFAIKTLRVE